MAPVAQGPTFSAKRLIMAGPGLEIFRFGLCVIPTHRVRAHTQLHALPDRVHALLWRPQVVREIRAAGTCGLLPPRADLASFAVALCRRKPTLCVPRGAHSTADGLQVHPRSAEELHEALEHTREHGQAKERASRIGADASVVRQFDAWHSRDQERLV